MCIFLWSHGHPTDYDFQGHPRAGYNLHEAGHSRAWRREVVVVVNSTRSWRHRQQHVIMLRVRHKRGAGAEGVWKCGCGSVRTPWTLYAWRSSWLALDGIELHPFHIIIMMPHSIHYASQPRPHFSIRYDYYGRAMS